MVIFRVTISQFIPVYKSSIYKQSIPACKALQTETDSVIQTCCFDGSFKLTNTEFNNLRKIIYLSKSEASVERISVCYVTENCWSMAYTVCHAPIPMTS